MLKALWKDPVWSAVFAGGIIAAVGAIGTYLLGLWPNVARWVGAAWNWLFLATSLSNWLLLLVSLSAAVSILILGLAAWGAFTGDENSGPHWTNYTTDEFFGLRWRWRYIDEKIHDLHTFCPRCDYQVFPYNASSFRAIDRILFTCDSCAQVLGDFDGPYSNLESKAERLIQQKIRNGACSTQ